MEPIGIKPNTRRNDKRHEPPRGWDRVARIALSFLTILLACITGFLAVGGGLVTEKLAGDVPQGFFPAADLMRWTARHTILWMVITAAIPMISLFAAMRLRRKPAVYLLLTCAFVILATLAAFLGYSYLRSHNFSHIQGIQV